jgi:hypothetical protein
VSNVYDAQGIMIEAVVDDGALQPRPSKQRASSLTTEQGRGSAAGEDARPRPRVRDFYFEMLGRGNRKGATDRATSRASDSQSHAVHCQPEAA